MSSRTFGRGFLADKLYNTEDAVPAGTFEQIQRRRKRRRPLGWLLPSLALVVLVGIGGYLYQSTRTNISTDLSVATVSSSEAKSSVSSRTIAEALPKAARGGSVSEKVTVNTPTRPSSAPSDAAVERVSASQRVIQDNSEASHTDEVKSATDPRNTKRSGGEVSVVAVTRRKSIQRPERAHGQPSAAASMRESHSVARPWGTETEVASTDQSSKTLAEMPANPSLAYDLGLLEASSTIDSRLTPLALQPREASPLAVYPVGVNKNLFSHLKLTEVLVDFGPTALTQKVRFTERNFSPEQGKFSTLYTEPGIGLEAGITVRSQLSPWLGLLTGVRSRVFWQTVSGKIKTSESSPVTYTSIDAYTVQAQPQLVEQGYTLRSTIWMPIIPELLLEFRPPNATWGIAAGGYLNAYPQSFLSYRGQGAPAAPFTPGATLQPVAQIWTQTSRTRLALSIRRIQGSDLLPHPVHSTSDGLLTSVTMSYRFGW